MKHLLDANTLIEAKNRYYSMSVCPGFWAWIRLQHQARELASISMVGDELKKGKDDLAEWAKNYPTLFQDISDDATQHAFTQVVEALVEQASRMNPGVLEDFLDGADAWLIAKAMATGATVVTHEVYNPAIKRKFSIPNVCELFGVPYMNTFELLEKLEAQFVLPH